uniref:Uncharacterized protein n=1 Tax=Engystomops pustulosus TaxID=76066 RepID=A0AAV6YNM4_ENGPU|nr:hypothetical protein GDO81_028648 [Engystomops pustulosus]
MFAVVCRYSRDFGPVLHSDIQVSGLLLGSIEFRLSPKTLHWFQVWRPLLDKEMLYTEPLLSCPSCVLGHCHTGRHSHDSSSMPLLREDGYWAKSCDTLPPSILPSILGSRPVSCAEKYLFTIIGATYRYPSPIDSYGTRAWFRAVAADKERACSILCLKNGRAALFSMERGG